MNGSDGAVRASIVAAMDAVAESLAGSVPVEETLSRITASALANLPSADHVSITVRRPDGRLETLAPTSELAVRIDALQYDLREGACYESITEDRRIVSPDLRHDRRWPKLGAAAADLGLHAQAAYVLENEAERMVLNVYSHEPNEFRDEDGLTELFAGFAAAVLGHAREAAQLAAAIGSRTIIGQATGIIMERYTLTPARAFDFLARLSQASNVKLRHVAVEIVNLTAEQASTT
jgi:hypothetical protein